jgi:hypothetical protein
MKEMQDLFKSEIADTVEKSLFDCPHCEHPIRKSEVLKAVAGVVTHNEGGGASRGKPSSKSVKGSRPGAAAKPDDGGLPGMQSVNKGDHCSDDDEDDMEKAKPAMVAKKPAAPMAMPAGMKKSYVDYVEGDDAAIAEMIAQGLGIGNLTMQPIDKARRS